MPTLAAIKAKLKGVLDATSQFGSVYTEDVERIEKPDPAAIVMWHDGGSQSPQANTAEEVTTILVLDLMVLMGPNGSNPGPEVVMQRNLDSKLEAVRTAVRKNPTLATSGAPLVLSCRVQSWDNTVVRDSNERPIRMQSEIKVAVTYEEE